MPDRSSDLLALQERFGQDILVQSETDRAPYLIDHRRLYHGHALAVALPRTIEQVQGLVALCHERGIGVVPQGGNTGYCGAATPDESGSQLVLGLGRLNKVRSVDAQNFSMTVEAGCILANVQRAASEADRLFPLSLGSEGSCQIGGNLSTNAGGLNVLRYGMARELVLGIEAVLADGTLYPGLTALRKDNTGYDLKSLLVGAEGTLGIITAATLKLFPATRASATAFVAVRDVAAAVALLGRLRSAGSDALSSFELIPRNAIELTVQQIPGSVDPLGAGYTWHVLCELTSAAAEPLAERLEAALREASEAGLVLDAALATSERQRQQFWHLREHIPEAQRLASGASFKHDIAVPISALDAFIAEASAAVAHAAPQATLICYGHAGDGNLHFNVNSPGREVTPALRASEESIKRAVHDLVQRHGGSISAEHGIGRLKREELARYATPAKMATLRAIKQALDPRGILNPGKVL